MERSVHSRSQDQAIPAESGLRAPAGSAAVPLCDLGFGQLACFLSLKPLSACEGILPTATSADAASASEKFTSLNAGSDHPPEDPVPGIGVDDEAKISRARSAGHLPGSQRRHLGQMQRSEQHVKADGSQSVSFADQSCPSSSSSSMMPSAELDGAARAADESRAEQGRRARRHTTEDSPNRTSVSTACQGVDRDCTGDSRYGMGRQANRRKTETSCLSGASFETLANEQALLQFAVNSGRLVEAQRRISDLRVLESTKKHSPSALFGRLSDDVDRVVASYTESLEELMLKTGDNWEMEHDEAEELDVASRLSDCAFQFRLSKVYHGLDAFQAFAGLFMFRWCLQVEELKHFEQLPYSSSLDYDSLLHVCQQGHGGKEDNIVHISCLDALDEPLGALWLACYTPSVEGAADFQGTPLPRPAKGAVRLSSWRSSFAITPVWSYDAPSSSSSSSQPGVKITYALTRRPSAAACIFPSVLRKKVGAMLQNFEKFLDEKDWNNWHTEAGPLAPFYKSIWRRIRQTEPYSISSPLSFRSSLQEIAERVGLQEDWADYHEPYPVASGRAGHWSGA